MFNIIYKISTVYLMLKKTYSIVPSIKKSLIINLPCLIQQSQKITFFVLRPKFIYDKMNCTFYLGVKPFLVGQNQFTRIVKYMRGFQLFSTRFSTTGTWVIHDGTISDTHWMIMNSILAQPKCKKIIAVGYSFMSFFVQSPYLKMPDSIWKRLLPPFLCWNPIPRQWFSIFSDSFVWWRISITPSRSPSELQSSFSIPISSWSSNLSWIYIHSFRNVLRFTMYSVGMLSLFCKTRYSLKLILRSKKGETYPLFFYSIVDPFHLFFFYRNCVLPACKWINTTIIIITLTLLLLSFVFFSRTRLVF